MSKIEEDDEIEDEANAKIDALGDSDGSSSSDFSEDLEDLDDPSIQVDDSDLMSESLASETSSKQTKGSTSKALDDLSDPFSMFSKPAVQTSTVSTMTDVETDDAGTGTVSVLTEDASVMVQSDM